MYPVALAHGFFGFAEMAGIEYFKGVKHYLENEFPDLTVMVTEVAPNDFVEERAGQLWQQIEKADEKVHIIGHSMGGLDARFMISPEGLNKSERVASLTTISTPHRGSPVADFITEKCEEFGSRDIDQFIRKLPSLNREAKKIVKTLKGKGEVWRYLLEFLNFSQEGMRNLTTSYLRQFNGKYHDAPEVKYFSYAGVTGPGEKDYLPAVMYISWAIVFLSDDEVVGGRNDGVVAVDSAKWGDYKGEIPADHFKQVGHDLSGLGWLRRLLPWLRPFNHLKFFAKIVNELNNLEKN